MKKLLAILGTIAISSTGASLVIACNNPNSKPSVEPDKTTPKNKPKETAKEETDKNSTNKTDKNSKESSDKNNTVLTKRSWNSVFNDSLTGYDIIYKLDETVLQNNKHYKFFVNSSSNLVSDLFDDKFAEEVKEAKNRWDKIQAKKTKLEKERLYKEFTTSSSNATEEYFKLLDEIHNREKKEEEWIKSEIEKIEKILKDEDFRDGIAKTIKDLFDAIEENKIAANKRELKEKLEEISDSVTDNSRAANGISNWIGVDKETRDYISSISDSILNNATAVNGNGSSED